MRACKELGIQTVGVYSEADENALFAKYADEVGATRVNLLKADGQDLPLGGLFIGDPPPQVHLAPDHAAFLAHAPKLRKDVFHEMLALVLHVMEGRGDKYTDYPVFL